MKTAVYILLSRCLDLSVPTRRSWFVFRHASGLHVVDRNSQSTHVPDQHQSIVDHFPSGFVRPMSRGRWGGVLQIVPTRFGIRPG